jgi:hypothetical protein
MRWKPVVVQSVRSDGSLVVTIGHPLVDALSRGHLGPLDRAGAAARALIWSPPTGQRRCVCWPCDTHRRATRW